MNCYSPTKTFYMKKFIASFLILTSTLLAAGQQSVITGKVSTKNPEDSVAHVSVTIKGTNTGTITDEKGGFSIAASSLPVTLSFTSINFHPLEVLVKSTDAGTIDLQPVP